MMEASKRLQRRLRERRYEKALRSCAEILNGVGMVTTDQDFVPLDDIERIWAPYVSRLRGGGESAARWSVDDRESVQMQLDRIADAVDGLRVVWLALVDSEPVGVDVSADIPLRAALTYFVSAAGDLMLATPDTESGICVELNHLSSGDEYEVVSWGAFTP